MSNSPLKYVARILVLALAAVFILFVAYLSIGRQFMPAVTSYTSEVEDWLSESLGIPVTIASLSGFFDGFNPAIELEGLRFNVLEPSAPAAEDEAGLEFESAYITLDMARTLMERRLVLKNFAVQGLDVAARRTGENTWLISGINLQGNGTLDLNDAYETFQRIERLELSDLSIELELSNGISTRFRDVRTVIQNQAGNHFIHVNGFMGNSSEELTLSLELTGESLNQIDGVLHASLPLNDYSSLTSGERFSDIVLGDLVGGGAAWLEFENGQVSSAVLQPQLERFGLTFGDGELLLFENLSGSARFTFFDSGLGWVFVANNLAMDWKDFHWQPADTHVSYQRNRAIRVNSEAMDVGILRDIAVSSGLLPDAVAERLTGHLPRGVLRNLSLTYSMQTITEGDLFLNANLDSVAVDTYRNAPMVAGVNGYLEVDFDADQNLVNGLAEVESETFRIQLPSLFRDAWSYDYVNGRLRFQVNAGNGFDLRLSSSMIEAESEIVDGRAQFSSRFERNAAGEVSSDLNLLVGAIRVDGSKKSPYLPSAPTINPGLYRTMEWLDGALLDGALFDSGVIYRGPFTPGTTDVQRNFQAFFNFNQGDVSYIDAWPELSEVVGTVVLDNLNASIDVDSGQTMGLAIGATSAEIEQRNNNQLWLTIQGSASGSSQAGLDFLNVAPLEATLGDTMANWQAQGDVNATVDLAIPLNVPGMEPRVIIVAELEDNRLVLPDYQLELDQVTGTVNFDSLSGLEESRLSARLFDGDADFTLVSQRDEAGEFVTVVAVAGEAEQQPLAAWPGQSQFVRDLLQRTRGSLNYLAELQIEQDFTRLVIDSDLEGLALDLPQPFAKPAEEPRSLDLSIEFAAPVTRIEGGLGSGLSMQVDVIGETLDGIVYLGSMSGITDPWQTELDAPGLELRGDLEMFEVAEWLSMFSTAATQGYSSDALTRWISRVRLDIGTLDIFGQQLESVNLNIEDLLGTDYWTVALDSQAVSGSVLLPFDENEYIEAYLAYLRLPGGADDNADPGADGGIADTGSVDVAAMADEDDDVREDLLAGLDPRNFPRLRFFTGELSIGERNYGRGRFTVDSGPDGAQFSDLFVDFRGLRLGQTDEDPSFFWQFDGTTHHSYLSGVIQAGNIAQVLLANGYAASLESSSARFDAALNWPGTPAFLRADDLSGEVRLRIEDGRFLQGSGGPGALKLISIINLDAIMRRLRFSDDLLRRGLAYEEITGNLTLDRGVVTINDQLVITGPSSVYQISGTIDLAAQTIDGEMYITLPLSDNIPWLGLLGAISGTLNPSLAIGAYLFERIFGDQVDSLTSAQYRLQGSWDGLQPELEQAFGTPPEAVTGDAATSGAGNQ